MAKKKVRGTLLELKIAESNLEAKIREFESLKYRHAEVATERDFLRKIVANLSEWRR